MKTKNIVILLINVILTCSLYAQINSKACNRTVAFVEDKNFLPSDFCMPLGYWVVDVFKRFETDVNNDSINDRFIQYNKMDWKCGDTVFIAIYLGKKDHTYTFAKTLSNLCPPMAEYSDLSWLVKNCKDPYSDRWGYDNISLISFEKGLIKVPFSINLFKGFDFYFEYDSNRKNWYLTKKQGWDIPDGGLTGTIKDITHEGYLIEKVENGISIDDFRIGDYLVPE